MAADAGIGIADATPRYFTYDGDPTLLLGGSSEDDLFQVPGVEAELDALADAGGNYVRCTMSSRDGGSLQPFERRAGGYDLDAPNDAYWERFDAFLDATAGRDVVVQVELWATFDYYRGPWAENPFNPANTVSYTAAESGLPEAVDSHPVETENDFFRSVPDALDLPVVREYQERFVDRLLAAALDHDHVLYCMDNETSVTPAWGEYWARYVKSRASERGKTVYTTEMWDAWDLSDPQHDNTFDRPDLYDFVDVSQNNHNDGGEHYRNALRARERVADAPRPLTNVKVYGGAGRFGSARDGVRRFLRNVFAGAASARFHRPPSGIGLDDRARRTIRAARAVSEAIDVPACAPRPDLVDAGAPAYPLADPGRAYALYLPEGGSPVLDIDDGGRLDCRYLDIASGTWTDGGTVHGNGGVRIEPPGSGSCIAVLTR